MNLQLIQYLNAMSSSAKDTNTTLILTLMLTLRAQ